MREQAALMAWRVVLRARISMVRLIGSMMEREFVNARLEGSTRAHRQQEYFCFVAAEVQRIHRHQHGAGRAPFFRLYDGRVFDADGRLQNPDLRLYDTHLH